MLMIAAAAVVLFATRSQAAFSQVLGCGLLASCFALTRGLWLAARPFRRVSALGFATAAIVTNTTCFVAPICSSWLVGVLISMCACALGMPLTFGFGAVWSRPPDRAPLISLRSRVLRRTINLVLTLAPLTMLVCQWPFQLAFLASQPALDRLADRVGRGNPVTDPEWAGAFRIVGSDVNVFTGGIRLITDPSQGGHSGFERSGRRPPGYYAYYALSYKRKLTEKWRYVEED